MKFLIVEADRSLIEALTIGLQFQWPDAAVTSACTGDQGLAAFQTEHPDIILLDAQIPQQGAVPVLRAIRATSAVPLLLLSTRHDEWRRVQSLGLGADAYLTKPFSHRDLFADIATVLQRADGPEPVQA